MPFLWRDKHVLTFYKRVKWVSLFLPKTRNSEQACINNCCYRWQNAHAKMEPDTRNRLSFGNVRLAVYDREFVEENLYHYVSRYSRVRLQEEYLSSICGRFMVISVGANRYHVLYLLLLMSADVCQQTSAEGDKVRDMSRSDHLPIRSPCC